jgi:hypothetical protein
LDLIVDFSVVIRIVYGIAAASVLASLLLVIQIVLMRRWTRMDEERRRKFHEQWEPILHKPSSVIPPLPRIKKRDVEDFIILWNGIDEAAAEDSGDQMSVRWYLDEVARRAGMVPIALRLARRGNTASRLIAVTMLGLLKEESATQVVETLSGSTLPVLSIAAAHALVQIDPLTARDFLTLRLKRNDWPPAKVDAIIEQERVLFAPVLVDAIFTLPAGMRLVRYLQFCDADEAIPALNRILDADTSDDATIRSALKVVGDLAPRDGTERIAKFLKHSNWEIRVQASNALGRMGDRSQVPALAELLGDTEWWVRYRAAQAIADLTDDASALGHIHDAQSDRYARDMLTQVIAERSYDAPQLVGV